MVLLCLVLNILLDTTRQTLRYGRIGRVKFINDGARFSKNRRIRLRNLSVPQGWVDIINVRLQLSQKMTLPCRSHSRLHMLSVVCCSLIFIPTPISGVYPITSFVRGIWSQTKKHADRQLHQKKRSCIHGCMSYCNRVIMRQNTVIRCLRGTASEEGEYCNRADGEERHTMRTVAPKACGGKLELNFDLTTPLLPCGRVTRLKNHKRRLTVEEISRPYPQMTRTFDPAISRLARYTYATR
jgi:hypothetical protein